MKTKVYSSILLFLITISLCMGNKAEVFANEETDNVKTYGFYQYLYEAETDSIQIVGYMGNEDIVYIPSEIEGKPVRRITNFDDYFDDYDYATANANVKEIYIPDGVVEIGGFHYKKNLKKVHIPDSVQKLSSLSFGVFEQCQNLKEITIPEGVTEIGDHAFRSCKKLQEVTIPASVTEILPFTFAGCSSLKKVTIPYGVKVIEDCAFSNCTSLKEINIPDSVTEIGEEAFWFCEKLTKVKLSNNIKVIPKNSFCCCNIKTLQLPKELRKIKYRAFQGNPLTKVTIPSKVTHIRNSAFLGCTELKKIVFKGTRIKNIQRKAFWMIHPKAVFDVPNKSIHKYKKMLIAGKNFKEGKMKIK